MHFKENTILALNGIRSNKMRAALTMLGIIIGIASVITIVTVGNSMTASVSAVLNDMGANSIELDVSIKPDESGNFDYSYERVEGDYFTKDMIDEYVDVFSDKILAYAYTVYAGSCESTNGRNKAFGDLTGINANGQKIMNFQTLAGHFITQREDEGMKNVVVISDKFADKLFPGLDYNKVLSKEVKVLINENQYTFNVVGVYRYEVKGFAANLTGDTSTNLFIPIGLAQKITTRDQYKNGFSWLQVRAKDSVTDSQQFADQSTKFMNKRFFRSNKKVEVTSFNMESMVKQSESMMGTLKLAIGIIAGISLLVGGIGVMNIMMVSVTERTREIGTRKALGAKNQSIRIQFIMEAMIICLIGGIIGILIGTLFGYIGSNLLGQASFPDVLTVAVAVGFSMAIGVFFGYYPANKAAKLNPIDALRYE